MMKWTRAQPRRLEQAKLSNTIKIRKIRLKSHRNAMDQQRVNETGMRPMERYDEPQHP